MEENPVREREPGWPEIQEELSACLTLYFSASVIFIFLYSFSILLVFVRSEELEFRYRR